MTFAAEVERCVGAAFARLKSGCGVIGLIAVSMLTDHTNKDVSEEYEGV